jgi:hypothetical protein
VNQNACSLHTGDERPRPPRAGRIRQDAFEYLLVIGVVMTAVVIAVAALFPSNGSGLVTNVVTAVGNKITDVIS